MRKDEEAFLLVEEGKVNAPLIRLYRWDRLCLSLGHFQKEKENIKLPVVRRPTGGGALLHGWDLSFAIADLRESWGGTPSSIYRNISALLKEVFHNFGVDVGLGRFKGRYLDRFFCFWVPTLGELTYKRKKIVSVAMRTGKRAFLAHGSIYLNFDYKRASELLGVDEDLLRKRITSLKEMDINYTQFLTALCRTLRIIPACPDK